MTTEPLEPNVEHQQKPGITLVPERDCPHLWSRCRGLSRELSLPLAGPGGIEAAPIMVVGDALKVRFPGQGPKKGGEDLRVEWAHLDVRSRAGRNRRQPLVRAIRGRTRYDGLPVVLDGTAGLGEDTWLLSSLGHCVLAVEQHPVVFALMRDAWARTGISSPWRTRRIRPVWGDTLGLLRTMTGQPAAGHRQARSWSPVPRPDVVYLDPMFPNHGQRKTAERKPLRLLRTLLGDTLEEAPELLSLALEAARFRVVVKRPLKAPGYACQDFAPNHQVFGRSVRFDVYTPD